MHLPRSRDILKIIPELMADVARRLRIERQKDEIQAQSLLIIVVKQINGNETTTTKESPAGTSARAFGITVKT